MTGTGVAIPAGTKRGVGFPPAFSSRHARTRLRQKCATSTPAKAFWTPWRDQAELLQRNVTGEDRNRLDQYFTSVRDLEHRLQTSRGWENKPKPVVTDAEPVDPTSPAQYMDKVKLMYDLARLAFETDSTRAITLMLNSVGTPVLQIPGRDHHRRLSQPFAPRQGAGQARAVEDH